MAFVSRDEGASWEGGLMIDERRGISYPDGFEDPDGNIHIIYDRNRARDREILMARFTEADVLERDWISPSSQSRIMVHKALGGLDDDS